MSSRPEVDGGPLLANGAGIAPAKRFPMELSPVSTPAGPGWIGMSGGAVAWLSLGELDEAKAAAYWKGPVKKVKTCPLSAADLETVARGDPVLTLRPVGTAFQFKVWQQLTGIEFATTSTYSTIAAKLGSPARARAVGAAVGANPIAWLIPCHRVVPAGGGTGRYRWGAAAKEKLLAWEKSRANGGTDEQAAVEVRKLEAMLLNAQRFEDISRLAGSIAHDLNNLLAPIRMAMELLKRKSSDPSLERYFDIIETSTNRARSVIQGILGFARESNGSIARIVAVQPVLRELENMASETFPSEITIAFDYDGGSSRVKIDPDQLHRALLNLLVNARDAMDGPGRITVKTSSHEVERGVCLGERCLDPGRYVCISVSDTGCGIPAGIRDNIFDPFFTTKPKEDGTGLGLATVFGTISRAGGFIDLESAEGKGTTFHLFLPEVRGA